MEVIAYYLYFMLLFLEANTHKRVTAAVPRYRFAQHSETDLKG